MSTNQKINDYIKSYTDWRGDRLEQLCNLIESTSSELQPDFKWSVPVWTANGMVCAISAFKDHVKINFFKGAQLNDKSNLFNSGLDSKDHRSINFAEDDKLNESAIRDLIEQSVNLQ